MLFWHHQVYIHWLWDVFERLKERTHLWCDMTTKVLLKTSNIWSLHLKSTKTYEIAYRQDVKVCSTIFVASVDWDDYYFGSIFIYWSFQLKFDLCSSYCKNVNRLIIQFACFSKKYKSLSFYFHRELWFFAYSIVNSQVLSFSIFALKFDFEIIK